MGEGTLYRGEDKPGEKNLPYRFLILNTVLPARHRLETYQEIERVKNKGKLYQTSLFGLLVLRNQTSGLTRFCFIVSLKISPKSTIRNRVKRLLAEALRGRLIKIPPGFDLVFLVKKTIIGKNIEEIKKEVDTVFGKAGLLGS